MSTDRTDTDSTPERPAETGEVDSAGTASGMPQVPPPYPGEQGQGPLGEPYIVKKTSGYAITSLICGIVSIATTGFCFPLGIVAIVTGHMALKEIAGLGEYVEGRGLAIAGLIMGYVSCAIFALIILFYIGMFLLALGISAVAPPP